MSTHESNDWRCGVIYTVRPEIMRPLETGREYRILVGVRRTAPEGEAFRSYEPLYRRALAITDARVGALVSPVGISRWTELHGWRTVEFGHRALVFVFIATMVKAGAGEALVGERMPAVEEFSEPGGASLEALQARHQARVRYDEFYNDFDHQRAGDEPSEPDTLFSYGEYVPSADGVDFAPFIRRAEAMARYHYGAELEIVRRDCFCATYPDLAVVHLFFRA